MKSATATGGVDWIFHRLAFAEQTRARVEEHMARPTPYVLMDLVALDAVQEIEAITRPPPKQG